MMRSQWFRSRAVWTGALLAVVVATYGCTGAPVHAEKAQADEHDTLQEVLAKVGERDILRAEVEGRVSGELYQNLQERHQIVERGLNAAVEEALIEVEAESQGMTVEEYVEQEIVSKIPEVSDEEIEAFYEARKAQIREPKESVTERIAQFLQQQKGSERRAEVLEQLKEKHGISNLLEPLRANVAAAGPALGPEQAPVTIVEFSDFECPYCARLVPTLKEVEKAYGDRVRLVFRQFPLRGIHPNAQKAAEASLCADEQGQFWEMHDLMFEEQRSLGAEQLKEKASRLGLDAASFNECLDSGRFAEQIAEDLKAGGAVGVSGTPALFINGRFLNGAQPFDAIAAIIDQELDSAGTGS